MIIFFSIFDITCTCLYIKTIWLMYCLYMLKISSMYTCTLYRDKFYLWYEYLMIHVHVHLYFTFSHFILVEKQMVDIYIYIYIINYKHNVVFVPGVLWFLIHISWGRRKWKKMCDKYSVNINRFNCCKFN